MGPLGYGATDQSASFENDGNQVSTLSYTGENKTLGEVDAIQIMYHQQVGLKLLKHQSQMKVLKLNDQVMFVASCVMVYIYS